uniref:Uncharacterized protein n=1 Tax=Arundo donax TaxID=35708 RepID=A0A0A9FCY8_ARUDO
MAGRRHRRQNPAPGRPQSPPPGEDGKGAATRASSSPRTKKEPLFRNQLQEREEMGALEGLLGRAERE